MTGRDDNYLWLMDADELHRTEVRIGDEGFCGVGDQDPEGWFPEVEWPNHPDVQQQSLNAAAKQCSSDLFGVCPVREACALAALNRGEQYGIWGGLPGWALHKIRRARGSKVREVLVELGAEWLLPAMTRKAGQRAVAATPGKNATRTTSSSELAA